MEMGIIQLRRTNVITEKRILDKIEKIYKDGIKLLKWQREKKDNFTCDTHIKLERIVSTIIRRHVL